MRCHMRSILTNLPHALGSTANGLRYFHMEDLISGITFLAHTIKGCSLITNSLCITSTEAISCFLLDSSLPNIANNKNNWLLLPLTAIFTRDWLDRNCSKKTKTLILYTA